MSLYPNRAHHIYKAPGDPKWKSSRVPLATGLIDAAVSNQCATFYGAYWADKTRFAVLDIDERSKYHNAQELQRLRTELAAVGLSGTVLYQSSNSTGWHLYIPFDAPADSKDIEKSLKAYLKAAGYEVVGGQLEVFPSGNALRLPLQAGFAWLDAAAAVVLRREDLGKEAAISRFLLDLESNSNDWPQAKTLIDSQLHVAAAAAGGDAQEHAKAISGEGFDALFNYRLIQENYEKGRQYWQTGLTEKNQRHDAIMCVEHYLWHGDSVAGLPAHPGRFNDKARYRLIKRWLEEKHNGFCKHVNAGDWETVEGDIKRAVAWRADKDGKAPEQEEYPLTERAQEVLEARSMATGRVWTMDDLKKGNAGRERKARRKIQKALDHCLTYGIPITRNRMARQSGCSPNTVSKHRDIWGAFASGSGDQSLGGVGGAQRFSESGGSEKDFLNSPVVADSGDLDPGQDGGSEESPPLLSCLAEKPSAGTQRQGQALRVASQVLTPGPELRAIQAVRQEAAGGELFLLSSSSAAIGGALKVPMADAFRQRHRRAYVFLMPGDALREPCTKHFELKHRRMKRGPPKCKHLMTGCLWQCELCRRHHIWCLISQSDSVLKGNTGLA